MKIIADIFIALVSVKTYNSTAEGDHNLDVEGLKPS